ncbi:MAG: HNH endonuclease family protein [Methanomassiliicoccales archaeon]
MIMDANKIYINPTYQREFIWTKSQQQLLIDSLLCDIDIPKIYLRKINDKKNGSYEYEVVDGQQRIRSIVNFLDNQFNLPNDTDPIDGHNVAGMFFKDFPTEIQIIFNNRTLDIVHLIEYSDDEIEDMFLRLQNGAPLNAAEKRKALAGKMGTVVKKLSESKVFEFVDFSNKRYGYEDASAKILHIEINKKITDIKPASIKKTYTLHHNIDESDPAVTNVNKSFNFIRKAFKGKQNPKLKKYAILTMTHLVADLLVEYDLKNYSSEFADAYLDFEAKRILNSSLDEDKQDPELNAYTEAARNDSTDAMTYRYNVLRKHILKEIPKLQMLDPDRDFSDEQRFFIYHKYKGICQLCGKVVDEKNYHADHIKAHSNGGSTSIENGQLLCEDCNRKKSAKTV